MPHIELAEQIARFKLQIEAYLSWMASFDLMAQAIPGYKPGDSGHELPVKLKAVRMRQIQARTDMLDAGRVLTQGLLDNRHSTENLQRLIMAVDAGRVEYVRKTWNYVNQDLQALVRDAAD